MLRRLPLWGWLLGALFLCGVAYLIPIPEKMCSYNPEADQEYCTLHSVSALSLIGAFLNENSPALGFLATVAIAAFTFTLWRATSGLVESAKQQSRDMRESLDTARDAADAAETSAQAAKTQAEIADKSFRDLERPYVFVNRIEVTFTRSPSIPHPGLQIGFFNYGRTPAIMESFLLSFHILGPDPQDGTVIQSGIESRSLPSVIGPQQPSASHILTLTIPWGNWDRIQKGDERLSLQISVYYADVFSNQWRDDFHYLWSRELATLLWVERPKTSPR